MPHCIRAAYPYQCDAQSLTLKRSLPTFFLQAIVDEIQARVNDLESQHTATLNAAKSTLGLWSQAGVGESKQVRIDSVIA